MRVTDIAIVGGGLAGSTAAAMLGRAGISTILIDPHTAYPPDLRCEKLDSSQVDILKKTGLAPSVLPATTRDDTVWIARFGRVIDKRPGDQHGIMYHDLVNTMRAAIPATVEIIHDKAVDIATGSERQCIRLSNGDEVSARLIVLANGLNVGLRHNIGLTRTIISACHSITIGFDLKPVARPRFDFGALTYYPESAADHAAYLTLFPIGSSMRANLMVYRPMEDPWLRECRSDPQKALFDLMPNLRRITGEVDIVGPVKVRPADLYVTEGHRQPGIVLVGDAFATSCPAAGTGTSKVFTDVERLCNVHIPSWLATNGMGTDKIATFYDDPVKQACDSASREKAYDLRSISIGTGLTWHAHRWLRFVARLGVGTLRQMREAMSPRVPARQ
ncbi:2-polyprenyl-6-methoxyphenol hydroxylase [Afipia sp. Root123D2]|uniref:FAD-dependent oxidoreductase n=1 Tax=Afipia sp. Root123D2 TaxID=1736436 RepID=UPI0006FCDF3F|nr:NAD(P)/FAD-dependent oxidoreductase [Afipia sp. Root123D2]KQW23500.1 2-polyprenyl-6-methoxyphenol hydroxylase [Afipia sp. Root123D2]